MALLNVQQILVEVTSKKDKNKEKIKKKATSMYRQEEKRQFVGKKKKKNKNERKVALIRISKGLKNLPKQSLDKC